MSKLPNQLPARLPRSYRAEFPGEIVRVLNASIHAEAARWRDIMRRVAGRNTGPIA
jgi:hypothetical protein